MSVLWDELPWPEIVRKLENGAPVLLPMGSVEAHGPHLPTGTDLMQAFYTCVEVAKRAKGLVLPPIHYGECTTLSGVKGTITISSDTVRSLVYEVAEGAISAGAKKLMMITGHAGQIHMASIREAAILLSKEHPDVRIWTLTDYLIAMESVDERFPKEDGHGGDLETSRMLHIRPDLVRKLPKKKYITTPRFEVLPNPEKLYPEGVMGNPIGATGEKGKFVDEKVVEHLVNLVRS